MISACSAGEQMGNVHGASKMVDDSFNETLRIHVSMNASNHSDLVECAFREIFNLLPGSDSQGQGVGTVWPVDGGWWGGAMGPGAAGFEGGQGGWCEWFRSCPPAWRPPP